MVKASPREYSTTFYSSIQSTSTCRAVTQPTSQTDGSREIVLNWKHPGRLLDLGLRPPRTFCLGLSTYTLTPTETVSMTMIAKKATKTVKNYWTVEMVVEMIQH